VRLTLIFRLAKVTKITEYISQKPSYRPFDHFEKAVTGGKVRHPANLPWS